MLTELQRIILEAGKIALSYYRHLDRLQIQEKSPKDFVTAADRAVEEFLKDKLQQLAPDIGFFGEETGRSGSRSRRWVVDPIDGTHSFLRGQYFWSISLALEEEGDITYGLVYAPALGDLYAAQKGQGATRGGEAIQVTQIHRLEESMISTGFACLRAGKSENNLPRFNRIALATAGQRRFGSAALDLCLVADGQVDAFFEQDLNLYDVAAGALILEEAGGMVMDFQGKRCLNPKELLAINGPLREAILALI